MAITSTNAADLPYRPCAGIALFNKQGQVFVGKRIDTSTEAWQLPQGGIDEGEDPLAAARREMLEEIGTANARLVAQIDEWLTYDLPADLIGTALKGKYRGQKQRWFAFMFEGTDDDINLETEHPEFASWRWAELEQIPALIVPFKKALYQQVVAGFAAARDGIKAGTV